jgi:acetyltransferase-like isoleucine patch superfamily enzyme
MGAGFVLYDLLFVFFATLLYGGAIAAGVRAFVAASARIPWPLAVVPALVVALLALIVEVFVATSLCPPLRPGRYRMMKSVTFYSWIFRSMFRRLLFDCGLRWLLFSSNVLRFLAFRALGARVHFAASMSTDVTVTDPALLVVGAGAMIGSRSYLAGHWVEHGRLVLAKIEIGEGSLLALDVLCSPGVVIGKKVTVKAGAVLAPNVRIDDHADIGAFCEVDAAAHVGRDARLAARAYVAQRQVVAAGTRFP